MTPIPESLGQNKLNEFLDRSLSCGRIPHALIISGNRGSGKLNIARQFAKDCLETDRDIHPDIRIVDLNEEKISYVDTIREVIGNLCLSPFSGKYKFFIICGAAKMPREAQNAILKSLEEPPEYVSIIMLTDNPGQLLPTIRSRAVCISMQHVETDIITDFLIREHGIEPKKAGAVAGLCMGNPTRALTILNDEAYMEIAESLPRTFSNIVRQGLHLSMQDEFTLFREEFRKFLELMDIFIRDVLVYKSTGKVEEILYSPWKQDVIYMAQNGSYAGIGRIMRRISETKFALLSNVGKDVLLELLLLEIGGIDQ